MNHYQGEDLSFRLTLDSMGAKGITSWKELKRVCVYGYTEGLYKAKFDINFANGDAVVTEGYQPLIVIDDNTISGTLTTINTRNFSAGTLMLEILAEDKSGTSIIKQVKTAIKIKECEIQHEAQ